MYFVLLEQNRNTQKQVKKAAALAWIHQLLNFVQFDRKI